MVLWVRDGFLVNWLGVKGDGLEKSQEDSEHLDDSVGPALGGDFQKCNCVSLANTER